MSQDTSPVHSYTAGWTYPVCLGVSNHYSADTLCQVLQLGVSTTQNPLLQSHIKVSPNPFQERLTISNATNGQWGVSALRPNGQACV